jgi:hypothetical protein
MTSANDIRITQKSRFERLTGVPELHELCCAMCQAEAALGMAQAGAAFDELVEGEGD